MFVCFLKGWLIHQECNHSDQTNIWRIFLCKYIYIYIWLFFSKKKVRIKCYLTLRKLSLNVQSAGHSSEKELCGLGNPFICKDGRTFRRTCLRRTIWEDREKKDRVQRLGSLEPWLQTWSTKAIPTFQNKICNKGGRMKKYLRFPSIRYEWESLPWSSDWLVCSWSRLQE